MCIAYRSLFHRIGPGIDLVGNRKGILYEIIMFGPAVHRDRAAMYPCLECRHIDIKPTWLVLIPYLGISRKAEGKRASIYIIVLILFSG